MRYPFAPVILLATTLAVGMPQSTFVGKWETRISRLTKKSAITVNIVEHDQRIGGTVVLVNPDASEIELRMLNIKVTDRAIEFETHDENDTFYWSLTLQENSKRGLLHGSSREMLIDERVRKQH